MFPWAPHKLRNPNRLNKQTKGLEGKLGERIKQEKQKEKTFPQIVVISKI